MKIEDFMNFPLVSCAQGTLIISVPEFFKRIARLDTKAGQLEINVTSRGRAELEWILDADGMFYELESAGVIPLSLPQRLGLFRARERFRILPARRITAGELARRIVGLHEQFEEAPNVADLQELVGALPPDHVLGRDEMRSYLGE